MPGIQIADTLYPKNDNTFPVVEADDVLGGYHTVDIIQDMLDFPAGKRQEGMIFYVKTGTYTTGERYILKGGIDNANLEILTEDSDLDAFLIANFFTKNL